MLRQMPRISKTTARIFKIPSDSLQTVLIPIAVSLADSRGWLKEHDLNYNSYRSTENYRRFKQVNPIKGAEFYSKTLPNGFELVFQKY